MAKLYFKYGAMGSSKTAQALITKFNYEERGMRVLLLKPATDTREAEGIISSRVGLSSPCVTVAEGEDLFALFSSIRPRPDVVIADESQFFTARQVDELRAVVDEYDVPVLCFGLRTDFTTRLFSGSARLFEVADSIAEIKTICSCGAKATVNARLGASGRVVVHGEKIVIGGNEKYIAMCHKCWQKAIKDSKK